jgi:ribosomal protein S18 acetylase RimI-like enzyme
MLRLTPPSNAHIDALMQWFPDAASVAVWSPSTSFPFVDRVRFIMESKLDELPSYVLVNDHDAPLAFGQYYARLGCCHLGRLVVMPARRGAGLGSELIGQLMEKGSAELGTVRCSLFVLEHNTAARKLYARLGFVETPYPERMPLPDCLYLTRPYAGGA